MQWLDDISDSSDPSATDTDEVFEWLPIGVPFCDPNILYRADQKFIEAATILYDFREDRDMGNAIRQATGFDPSSLIFDGYHWAVHDQSVDLTILPDTNRSRSEC